MDGEGLPAPPPEGHKHTGLAVQTKCHAAKTDYSISGNKTPSISRVNDDEGKARPMRLLKNAVTSFY